MIIPAKRFTVLAVSLLFAVPVAAQLPLPNLADAGGQMHGAASVCGGYTGVQLRAMKQQQKVASIKAGMPAARFDATFAKSYAAARAKLLAVGPAERTRACQTLKSAAGMR